MQSLDADRSLLLPPMRPPDADRWTSADETLRRTAFEESAQTLLEGSQAGESASLRGLLHRELEAFGRRHEEVAERMDRLEGRVNSECVDLRRQLSESWHLLSTLQLEQEKMRESLGQLTRGREGATAARGSPQPDHGGFSSGLEIGGFSCGPELSPPQASPAPGWQRTLQPDWQQTLPPGQQTPPPRQQTPPPERQQTLPPRGAERGAERAPRGQPANLGELPAYSTLHDEVLQLRGALTRLQQEDTEALRTTMAGQRKLQEQLEEARMRVSLEQRAAADAEAMLGIVSRDRMLAREHGELLEELLGQQAGSSTTAVLPAFGGQAAQLQDVGPWRGLAVGPVRGVSPARLVARSFGSLVARSASPAQVARLATPLSAGGRPLVAEVPGGMQPRALHLQFGGAPASPQAAQRVVSYGQSLAASGPAARPMN